MKGDIVGSFIDQYEEERKLRKVGRRIQVAKNTDTVSHLMNRAAAKMIGSRIRCRRLAAGMTLEELCLKSGLVSATPKSRMWEIENSLRAEGLRMGTLFALAYALDCEVSDLMPSVKEVAADAGVAVTNLSSEKLRVVA